MSEPEDAQCMSRPKDYYFLEFLHQIEWLRAHPECDEMSADESYAMYEADQQKTKN